MSWRRFLPRTIGGQITGLIVLAASMTVLLNFAASSLLIAFDRGREPPPIGPFQVATIARLVDAARSEQEVAALVENARRIGIQVRRHDGAPPPALERAPRPRRGMPMFLFGPSPRPFPGMEQFGGHISRGADHTIRVELRSGGYLAFSVPPPPRRGPPFFFLFPAFLVLSMLAVTIVGLVFYAARSITAPLSAFAAAARGIGRTADAGPAIPERGPQEIAQMAQALNGMRKRIHALLGERTSMLSAISHDLRTLLTRIRLRTERIVQNEAAEGILLDVAQMEQMLVETLRYLRDDAEAEPFVRVDLPSMLETICLQLNELGKPVVYGGPATLVYRCQAGGMTRAITNLAENAVNHGSDAAVVLTQAAGGGVQIDVNDNGPGIPYPLRRQVFEPFFKIDSARTSRRSEGFGLGLSIARNVVEAHGGTIELLENAPRGLKVRITLPPAA